MSGIEKKRNVVGDDRPIIETGDEMSQSNFPANMQTHLAWMRTRMSVECTLESWVRTATALIGFGFTIVQIFEYNLRSAAPVKAPHLALYIGLLLIAIGTLTLGVAVWQYQRVIRYLLSETFRGIAGVPGLRRLYPALVVAVLLCLVGILAFFAILSKGGLGWAGAP